MYVITFFIFFLNFLCLGNSGFSDFFPNVGSLFFSETCSADYISPNYTKLQQSYVEKLFGQDIVISKIVSSIETHFSKEPRKALVLCMHGWTGSGKNYATNILIENIYKKKFDSKFVHFFNGQLHFPMTSRQYVDQYKISLQNWIRGNVSLCPRSIFVFDEVDKIPPGVIDGVKPFLDYYEKIDGINFRQAIFIFISNIGGGVINSRYMSLFRSGIKKKNMEYIDFEPYLRKSLYTEKGGFERSSVLEGHLVSLYLPFLPLDVREVRKCVLAEIARQELGFVSEDDINSLLSKMEFNSDGLFIYGCKRVADLVATLKYKRLDEL